MYQFQVSEIFKSIDGEGKRAGAPCTFIRLVGCNLRCSYCDTAYAFTRDSTTQIMTTTEITEQTDRFGISNVTLTGGEPLLHRAQALELVDMLKQHRHEVNIETNGAIRLDDIPRDNSTSFFTMDWKSRSSGMADKMIESNLDALLPRDVLKFVVGTQEDLDNMCQVLGTHDIKAQVFVSPVWGQMNLLDMTQFVLNNNINARVQVQLHKLIWAPDARGV